MLVTTFEPGFSVAKAVDERAVGRENSQAGFSERRLWAAGSVLSARPNQKIEAGNRSSSDDFNRSLCLKSFRLTR